MFYNIPIRTNGVGGIGRSFAKFFYVESTVVAAVALVAVSVVVFVVTAF